MNSRNNNRPSFTEKFWADAPFFQKEQDFMDYFLRISLERTGLGERVFFQPQLSDLWDPFLFSDMKKAVSRILRAIEKKERIIVFGDFDTDGITSTVSLVSALQKLGASVSYRIPDRNTDSHGLKKHIIDDIFSVGATLLITCDCGINDTDEIFYAREKGIDVVLTDHHSPDFSLDRSGAFSVLAPEISGYPFLYLAGVGIVFKLISALFQTLKKKEIDLFPYLEMVAVGTVADCAPLVGENRILARMGLEKLQNSSWSGFRKFFEKSQISSKNITEQTISFFIAPRLNASSRLSSVFLATQFFLGKESDQGSFLEMLEQLNTERKDLVQESFLQSLSQVREGAMCQIFFHEEWEQGILGLLAGRHSEKLQVPVIAMGLRSDGFLAGSCRSPEGLNIIEALRQHSHFFDRFGGHAGAAGFLSKRENLPEIFSSLNTFFAQNKKERIFPVTAFIDPQILSFSFVDFLKKLSPFGVGNPEPVVGIFDCIVLDYVRMGSQKNHLRLSVLCGRREISFVAFFAEEFFSKIRIDQKVDILFTVSDSYWKDQRRLELRVVDIRESENKK